MKARVENLSTIQKLRHGCKNVKHLPIIWPKAASDEMVREVAAADIQHQWSVFLLLSHRRQCWSSQKVCLFVFAEDGGPKNPKKRSMSTMQTLKTCSAYTRSTSYFASPNAHLSQCSSEDPCKTCIVAARAAAGSRALMWMDCIRPSFQTMNIFTRSTGSERSPINTY